MDGESLSCSPKKPSKDRTFCSIPGCSSRANKNRNLSFHLWPKKRAVKTTIINSFGNEDVVDCHAEWMRRFKMGKPNSLTMKVCSMHFVPEDYHYLGTNSKRKRLKRGALPSKCLPKTPEHDALTTRTEIIKKDYGENKKKSSKYKRNLFSECRSLPLRGWGM